MTRGTTSASVSAGGAILLLIVLVAYSNSLTGPFVFDDVPAVRDNPTIRNWREIGVTLSPPRQTTVTGRPLVNLSLAASYALSGGETWGYHAVNLAIHAAAALLLFGLVRRTLVRIARSARFGGDAPLIAFAAAALWALQPVQTEAVMYIVQRAESLMGLCFIATLYCFERSINSPRGRQWQVLSVVACALGMVSKEVMVSAPLMVLLYDRVFVAGTFREAWRRRAPVYTALAATWLVLGGLVASTGGNRGGSIGFGVGIGWWDHAVTQFQAITQYLRLLFWPHPLVFEYEPEWVSHFVDVAPQAMVVALLLALTLSGLWRNRAAGFVGAFCFAILAPTSLLPAPTQLIVEHRMYLASAPLIAALGTGMYVCAGRRGIVALLAVAVSFGILTAHRNHDYRSELALWMDTVAKRPRNPLAHGSLGNALSRAGRLDEALAHCTEAVCLDPKSALLRYDLGVVLAKLGRGTEAIEAYGEAVRLEPNYADAHNNLAVALARSGRREEALPEFVTSLRLRSDDPEAHFNYGALLGELGRTSEASEQFAAALRLKPDFAAAYVEWGTVLVRSGRFDEALERYRQAIRISAADTRVRNKAGLLLLALGRATEAITYFEDALRIKPDDAETQANLARARQRLEKPAPR